MASMRQRPHWDDDDTRDLMREGWSNLHQSSINEMVRSMPQRLKDIQKADGQLTGW